MPENKILTDDVYTEDRSEIPCPFVLSFLLFSDPFIGTWLLKKKKKNLFLYFLYFTKSYLLHLLWTLQNKREPGIPVFRAAWKAERGRLLEPSSLRSGWAT